MIPSSSFGTNSIRWNSEEDLFSVQYENTTVKDILDYIEKHSKYIFIYYRNIIFYFSPYFPIIIN